MLEIIEHVFMRWVIAYLAGNNARIMSGGLLVTDLVNLTGKIPGLKLPSIELCWQ